MQLKKLEVDGNLQETTKHGTYDFPIVIYTDQYNLLEEGQIRWHWHKELQFTYCLYDKIAVSIGNQKIELVAGEGILINSNVLHQIKPQVKYYSRMYSIVFDTSLISGSQQSIIDKKYLSPILNNKDLKFIRLQPMVLWQNSILEHLGILFSLYEVKEYGYELEMKICLGSLWLDLIREVKEEMKLKVSANWQEEERVKNALQYIHQYYSDNISLENIAIKANISKSECCRSFQRILHVTPFEYLMEYRVNMASELLLNSKKPISIIALDVGFNGTSYFGKTFKKYRNCTPSEYRKQYYEEWQRL